MKKIILVMVLALIANFSVSAQTGMYEALEANGKDAQYQQYWRVLSGDKEGTYTIGSQGSVVTAKIKKLASGTPVGFELINVEDGKTQARTSILGDYERPIGYPHITIRDRSTDDGYVVIGDYIFNLSNLSKDGLSFETIDGMFIKIGSAEETEEVKDEPEKKMSLKEKLKAAKAKLTAATTVSYGPEHKKASNINLKELILDYLKAMHDKQVANPQTAKKNAVLKEAENYRNKDAADIKAYNDSIKATPEYKKMKAHQRRMAEMEKNGGGEKVTIYNGSGSPIRVGSTTINAGSRQTFDCDFDVWLMRTDKSRNEVVRSRKLSSARSNCGQTVTVN